MMSTFKSSGAVCLQSSMGAGSARSTTQGFGGALDLKLSAGSQVKVAGDIGMAPWGGFKDRGKVVGTQKWKPLSNPAESASIDKISNCPPGVERN